MKACRQREYCARSGGSRLDGVLRLLCKMWVEWCEKFEEFEHLAFAWASA